MRQIHERSLRDPASVDLLGLEPTPEPCELMDVLADVDPDGLAGFGRIRSHDDLRDASRFDGDNGRGRDEPFLALEVRLEPQVLGERAGVVVAVVEVRRHAQAQERVGDAAPVPRHIIHVRVEVVGRREPERRRAQPGDVGILRDRRQSEWRGLGTLASRHLVERRGQVAGSAAGGHRRLHALIDAGEMGGEATAHRVAIDAEAGGVDLRLALQEGQAAAGGERDQEPVVVTGRIDRIEGEGVGLGAAGKVIDRITLGRMGGVECAPVGIEAVVELAIGEGHLVATPVEREARVATLRVGHDRREIRGLAAAMDMHQSGQGRGAFRKGIERRDSRRLTFEYAHTVADDLAGNAVDLPGLRHLDLEGFLARIIITPKCVEVSRGLAVLQRWQSLRTEVGH